MALTPEQIQRNRVTLANNLRTEMNLSNTPSEWTYDQRVAYNKAFAAYIESHKASFSVEDIANAKTIQQKNYTALEDEGYSFDIFVDQSLIEGSKILGISGTMLKNIIYTAAVGAVLYYLIPKIMDKWFEHKGKAAST